MNRRKLLNNRLFFWLPVSLIVLTLFGVMILSGRALFWGLPITQFVPWWLQTKLNLLEGGLPLWNPNLGMGAPLLANYQLGFFYPPNWLFLVAGWLGDAPAIAWMQGVLVALHLVWAAEGMRRLARTLGLPPFGQTVAALAFSFSGYLIARAWFLPITLAVSWLPWAMWAGYSLALEIRRVYVHKLSWWRDFETRRLITLAGVLGLQLLTGHAQVTWYSSGFLAAWVVFWAFQPIAAQQETEAPDNKNGWKETGLLFGVSVLFLGIAGLLAVGLAAIQLLPTAEYLMQSQRASAVAYEAAMTYSFWPWRFLGFLAPSLFGNPAFGNYWGYANFWEDAVYIGLLPFILAVSVLIKRQRNIYHQHRLGWFLFATLIVSFLLALGQNLPLFPWLYRHIPTFDMFNAPTRWSILAVFALALLAGIGAGYWSRPTGRTLYWTRLATAGGFAITLGALVGWLGLQQSADSTRLQTMAFAVALAGVWALGGGVLTLLAPLPAQSSPPEGGHRVTGWHLAAVLWIALDLAVAGYGLNPAESLSLYAGNPQYYVEIPPGRVYMPQEVEEDVKFDQYFLFTSFHAVDDWVKLRATFLPNIGVLNGRTAMVNNFDPIVPDRFATWISALERTNEEEIGPLLNLSGVSAVVNKDLEQPAGTSIQIRTPAIYLRAFRCQKFYQSADQLLTSMLADRQLLEHVLFVEGSGSDTIANCTFDDNVRFTLIDQTSTSKVIRTSAEAPFWLMLSESWYPGWQASIDGQQTTLYRADYLFQAVQVPAGEHEVRFEYGPLSFKLGIVLSLLSIGILSIFVLRNRLTHTL